MKFLLSGPVEGRLDAFYERVKDSGTCWAVCAGDFGIYPDPERMDRAARKHNYGTDFSKRYVGVTNKIVKVPVLTIAGVHDDHRFLNHRQSVGNTEILSNTHFLANGYRTSIGWDTAIRVTGLGRAYSEQTYNGQIGSKSHRHYTRRDIERGCSSGPTELLVIYEHLDAPGIRNLIFATRPKLILGVSHTNQPAHKEIQGIPVVQLGRNQCQIVEWVDNSFIL
jgi:hypothetical protein